MTDGYEILTSIIDTTQSGQYDLSAAMDFVSSTAIKSVLAEQLQSYDGIESEAQLLASQRGWEILLDRRYPERLKRRMQLRLRKTDSQIAEYLILYHEHSIIHGIKIFHRNKSYDEQINRLFQKLQFCQSSGIRQMQQFL